LALTTVDETTLAALKATDSPTVSNAIEALHVRGLTEGFTGPRIRCLFPELGTSLGFAVTVQVDSSSPGPAAIGAGLRDVTEFILAFAPRPVTLVYQDIGARPGYGAMFGDYAARLYQKLEVVALVTDGSVRDVFETQRLGFQYFAAGTVVSHGNPRLLHVNVPVVVDGMYVEPGDLIHGDVNGVVNIPVNVAARLPAEIERIREGERQEAEYLAGPDFNLDAALRRVGH
jgi:regulator of RNase E activity RraA